MEIICVPASAELFSIQEVSQIGEVRRYISHLAHELHFSEFEVANAAIIVTEMGTNLIKHTPLGGEILIQSFYENQQPKIELLAFDKGPGINNLGQCLQDGYSTANTQGSGLGAIQRLSQNFDIYTFPETGTALWAQLWPSLPSQASFSNHNTYPWGSICLRMLGETVCGDGWLIHENKQTAKQTILIIDGLGHGLGAHEAMQVALTNFQSNANQDLEHLFQLYHQALHKTRGAAIAMVQLDVQQRTLAFAGIGNIEGRLINQAKSHYLLSHTGIVGHVFRRAPVTSYRFDEGATLILHTDGIKNRWNMTAYPGLSAKHPSLVAGILYRDYKRGRDDATMLVLKLN